MAVGINQSNFGRLIDFFSGRLDLEQRIIRVLHKKSFIEDPTRIIRAVRFEQRYKFTFEPQTLHLAYQAINNRMIEELSSARLKEELVLLLKEADPIPPLERLVYLGIWDYVFPETSFTEEILPSYQKNRDNGNNQQRSNGSWLKARSQISGVFRRDFSSPLRQFGA